MSRSNLSIFGLYVAENDIFEGFSVPSGMDRNKAIDTILLKCAELESLYPDADFMKNAITLWSDTQQANWEKLFKTTVLEYNPIWNKDGTVTEIETVKNEKDSKGYNEDASKGSSSRHQDTENDGSLKVAAFNEGDLVDKEATHAEGEADETVEAENKNSSVYGNKDNENITRAYTRKEQGNIGVTTTQQMLREEREVAIFNMYDFIALDFKNRFCLLVY